jgi:hypothetical protein
MERGGERASEMDEDIIKWPYSQLMVRRNAVITELERLLTG